MAPNAFKIGGLLASVFAASSLMAAGVGPTVYQHSGSGNFSYTTAAEYGDEVVLQGWERVITGFEFDYDANYSLAGGLVFSLYEQNGPVISGAASPGSLIYSTTLDISSGRNTVVLDFGVDYSNMIPGRLTYTVKFAGLLPGRTGGLIAPGGTPVVGLSANDFWEKTGPGPNDWALKVFAPGSPSANFAAKITAVPEPGTVALMVAGAGLVLLAVRRK